MDSGLRKCASCKLDKPATLEFFQKHSGHSDGMGPYCRPCHSAKTRKNYLENKDYYVATQDAHSHVLTSQTATTGGATSYEHGALDTSSAEAEATEVTNPATATNQVATAVNQNATAVNQNAGGGGAHNNLQPYIVVNWIVKT